MNALRNIAQQLPGDMPGTLRPLDPVAVLRQLNFEPDGFEWHREGADFTETVLRVEREAEQAESLDGRGFVRWNRWRWDDPCDVFARMNDDDTCEHEKERATVLDAVAFFLWELAGLRGESWEQTAAHYNLIPKPS